MSNIILFIRIIKTSIVALRRYPWHCLAEAWPVAECCPKMNLVAGIPQQSAGRQGHRQS
jgi:hypothetical protein